jgi:hypothetical protein
MNSFRPGDTVVLDSHPEWGVGQVQSAIGDKVTVNFPEAGKQVLNSRWAQLRTIKS